MSLSYCWNLVKEVTISDIYLILKLSLRVYEYSVTIPSLDRGLVDDTHSPLCASSRPLRRIQEGSGRVKVGLAVFPSSSALLVTEATYHAEEACPAV